MLQQCGCSLVVELQPSKLIVWVRFPSSAPKKQGAQRVPFLFGQADRESKASVKKTVRRTVFSESADDTMSLLTPRKAAQVGSSQTNTHHPLQKNKAPNGCLFFLVKRIGNRRRALRKQSGGLFSARAQMTLCRCSRPGKRRRWLLSN